MNHFAEPTPPTRDIRPWEFPGNVRRDCDPHRALLLCVLGGAAFGCGFFAIATVVPALIAIPLGLAVWRMSEHDLRQMRWGQMDPRGRAGTILAQVWAWGGIFLSLFCWVPFAVWFLLRQ
jgi:hypothetical protein